MKLYITDNGDPSVGIFSATYEIDVPFDKDDVEQDDLDWFKKKMFEVYKNFSEGRLTLWYDCDIDEDSTSLFI